MIRIYNYKNKIVKAVQFYANYSEVEKFSGADILYNSKGHETLEGKLLNQSDFIINDSGVINVVSREQFRKEYEPV